VKLLEQYQKPEQPYIPRYAIEGEKETRDYDHLSRYREWILAGDS
jgi:hypothetical protein